jgi:hypothetical protein
MDGDGDIEVLIFGAIVELELKQFAVGVVSDGA